MSTRVCRIKAVRDSPCVLWSPIRCDVNWERWFHAYFFTVLRISLLTRSYGDRWSDIIWLGVWNITMYQSSTVHRFWTIRFRAHGSQRVKAGKTRFPKFSYLLISRWLNSYLPITQFRHSLGLIKDVVHTRMAILSTAAVLRTAYDTYTT